MAVRFLNRQYMGKRDYGVILDKIVESLSSLKTRSSLLVYGSSIKESFNPGVSDIDMVLFFYSDFVLDSEDMDRFNSNFSGYFKRHSLNPKGFLDATIIDSGNAMDGRFLSYNENFLKVFDSKVESMLMYGENFRSLLKPVALNHPAEERIAYNQENLRKYLLFYRNLGSKDADLDARFKHFQALRSLGRKVGDLLENRCMEKNEGARYLSTLFSDVDYSPIEKANFHFSDVDKMIRFVLSDESEEVLKKGLICYEQTLREIVKKYEMKSRR